MSVRRVAVFAEEGQEKASHPRRPREIERKKKRGRGDTAKSAGVVRKVFGVQCRSARSVDVIIMHAIFRTLRSRQCSPILYTVYFLESCADFEGVVVTHTHTSEGEGMGSPPRPGVKRLLWSCPRTPRSIIVYGARWLGHSLFAPV